LAKLTTRMLFAVATPTHIIDPILSVQGH
jgi:hypothetical protein